MSFDMDRIIKFRAKRSDNGQWIYGDLHHTVKICSEEETERTGKFTMPVIRVAGYDVDENTICQFTEAVDAEGNEIYVGDILVANQFDDVKNEVVWDNHLKSYVFYYYGLFKRTFTNSTPIGEVLERMSMIVIGNIYDNKELLNK